MARQPRIKYTEELKAERWQKTLPVSRCPYPVLKIFTLYDSQAITGAVANKLGRSGLELGDIECA